MACASFRSRRNSSPCVPTFDTATAKDTYDRTASDTANFYLPATNSFTYDLNGNLTNDSRRVFEYDYENQLTNVYVASAWKSASSP